MFEHFNKGFIQSGTLSGVTLVHESRDMEVGHEGGLCKRGSPH
jgi:hypothetical protein